VVIFDENGPVKEVVKGQEVGLSAFVASNDELIVNPTVTFGTIPEEALEFDPSDAEMTTDGVNWIQNNDPVNGGFFYLDTLGWTWDLKKVTGDMQPGDKAELVVPVVTIVVDEIYVQAELLSEERPGVYTIVDTDTYIIRSVAPQPVNGETVPMQETGSPLALAVLGLLGIAGGAIYGKLR
jgi:hypothetical protein